MDSYKVFQVDSFTKEKFKGNPAGVVLNADGLTDIQMQEIAREMNCSETVFILNPTSSNHEVWLRYFTPTREADICGHATIAAHYVRAKENKLSPATVMTKTGIGILPINIVKEIGDYKIVMTLGQAKFGGGLNGSEEKLLKALGLTTGELDTNCPLQLASTGSKVLMVGIKSRDKLNSLSPDMSQLIKLSEETGCLDYMVFTFDSNEKDILTCSRMFAPAIGIPEDPATGTASGSLGAYLVHNELIEIREDKAAFKNKQGEAINRTGLVEVLVEVEEGEPKKVQIGGHACIVFETEIHI